MDHNHRQSVNPIQNYLLVDSLQLTHPRLALCLHKLIELSPRLKQVAGE